MTTSLLAARDLALYRGLRYVERTTRTPVGAASLGSALLYALSFMATTAADPNVRSYARQLARRSYAYWRWNSGHVPDDADADTISEFVHAIGALERWGSAFLR